VKWALPFTIVNFTGHSGASWAPKERESTVAKFATVRQEGTRKVERKIDYYNLDAIISVGYRVNSISKE